MTHLSATEILLILLGAGVALGHDTTTLKCPKSGKNTVTTHKDLLTQ